MSESLKERVEYCLQKGGINTKEMHAVERVAFYSFFYGYGLVLVRDIWAENQRLEQENAALREVGGLCDYKKPLAKENSWSFKGEFENIVISRYWALYHMVYSCG